MNHPAMSSIASLNCKILTPGSSRQLDLRRDTIPRHIKTTVLVRFDEANLQERLYVRMNILVVTLQQLRKRARAHGSLVTQAVQKIIPPVRQRLQQCGNVGEINAFNRPLRRLSALRRDRKSTR